MEEEWKRRINEMPPGQWFSLFDIVGNGARAALWRYLIAMNVEKRRRPDGCSLQMEKHCTRFVWRS